MNEVRNLEGKLYQFTNYVAHMLLVNFYIVIGSLMGLIIFGIAPSVYAGLKLIKEMIEEDKDSNLFTRFMKYYRENFFKANKIGLSYVLLFLLLGINVYYYDSQLSDSFFKVGILVINYFLIFVTFLSFITYIGIDLRFNCGVKQQVKMSILFPIFYFLNTMGYLFAGVAVFFILTLFSQFIAFLFASAYCYLNHYYISAMVMKFKKLQKEKIEQQNLMVEAVI